MCVNVVEWARYLFVCHRFASGLSGGRVVPVTVRGRAFITGMQGVGEGAGWVRLFLFICFRASGAEFLWARVGLILG